MCPDKKERIMVFITRLNSARKSLLYRSQPCLLITVGDMTKCQNRLNFRFSRCFLFFSECADQFTDKTFLRMLLPKTIWRKMVSNHDKQSSSIRKKVHAVLFEGI